MYNHVSGAVKGEGLVGLLGLFSWASDGMQTQDTCKIMLNTGLKVCVYMHIHDCTLYMYNYYMKYKCRYT